MFKRRKVPPVGLPADKHVPSQWIGKKLKSLSIRHRTVNGRSEIILTPREYKTLLSQYGMALPPLTTDSLPEERQQQQDVTGVVGSSRDYPAEWDEETTSAETDHDHKYREAQDQTASREHDGQEKREETGGRADEKG